MVQSKLVPLLDATSTERATFFVVLHYFLHWYGYQACKAVAPSYYRLAREHENTIFIDVPVTVDNSNLHQGLRVPSLPYGHIYHPHGGLVEELRLTKTNVPEFAGKLQMYIQGFCDLASAPEVVASEQ
jgi:hypothetical protein